MNINTRRVQLFVRLVAAAGVACSAIAVLVAIQGQPVGQVQIKTLSADASRVTGGDVLVQVTLPDNAPLEAAQIALGGHDVTSAFQPGPAPHTLMGVVTGLVNGKNTLAVITKNGTPDASLVITNYPITGPVFSGPWIEPFICQTDAFKLPDGTTLGKPLDENCSAKTIVQYVYRTTGDKPEFKPLAIGATPTDMAKTTTTEGKMVNFIVRIETGTMDRGIYQNTILLIPRPTCHQRP
jgi:hypothetical protein